METFKAFLDYFTPDQWRIIYYVSMAIIAIATWLTNRYFRRRQREIKADFERRCKEAGIKPPYIPRPPE